MISLLKCLASACDNEKILLKKLLPSEIMLAISKSSEGSFTLSTLSQTRESADIGDCGTHSFDETDRYAQELLGDWGELSITRELLKRQKCVKLKFEFYKILRTHHTYYISSPHINSSI